MDEWNNQSFIIVRTRKEGNTVMKWRRGGEGGKGGKMNVDGGEAEEWRDGKRDWGGK